VGIADMNIELDHMIIPARESRASAQRLASIPGASWAESGVGPFCPVYAGNSRTLDFDQAEDAFSIRHYCFRVSEAVFDGVLAKLAALAADSSRTTHAAA
jgi:hypothetical protein